MNKLYSIPEAFVILFRAMRSLPVLRRSVKTGTLNEMWKERIMLAVTEVNGCAMCSYEHTKIALEAGMSGEEIAAMLAGEAGDVPKDELASVMFAQHYASNRGKPTKAAWERLNGVYGKEAARAVLAAVQVIMLGNTVGIPMGSLRGRIKGKREQVDARSSALYEVAMIFAMIVYMVPAALTALFCAALRVKLF